MADKPSTSSQPRTGGEGEIINELYFTGQGDPRHKCVAIGYHRNEPVVYKFDTVDLPQGTRTTVTYNEQFVVAFLDWALAVHLGSVIKGADREPMTDLVLPGSTETLVPPSPHPTSVQSRETLMTPIHLRARSFVSGRDGKEKFEWRRVGDKHPYGYEVGSVFAPRERRSFSRTLTNLVMSSPTQLFSLDPESRIARYDPTPRELPKIGRAYALLEYGFHEENLIRDALLALCLNRWIDWRGM
ncbi:hypothetical protein BD414DRAFT_141584 [Trametes punicea]|nr:hypothetical protein BD414DRAFT_141584 [Trametes punicea]